MSVLKIQEYTLSSKNDKNSLKNISSSITENIIEHVSKNGGYLSTNLSCVDVGLSLYSTFKNDHVYYCGDELDLISEIYTDNPDNESYSLSSCLSDAIKRDLKNDNYNVVSVINSDYLRSGKAIESLNQIGAEKRKMIIVFNDDTTISQGIGLVDRFVSGLRNTRTYNTIKSNVKDVIRSNKNGEKYIEDIHNFKSSIKKSMIHEGIFGEYDIEYIGPVDGHNYNELCRALEVAKTKDYPVVVHCISTSGKGYKLAEANTNGAWKEVDRFDISTGKAYAGEADNYLYPKHIISNELSKMMITNENIIILSKDILKDGISVLFGQYVNRCINTSSDAISLEMAAGFVRSGLYPYVCMNASELSTCYEQFSDYISKSAGGILISVIKDTDDISYLKDLNNIELVDGENEEIIKNTVHEFTKNDKPTVLLIKKQCIECK
ncbi:MAG: 1-deoxy-D-xylulose-5-phosphate synthase N-terminal domain-containing protein [Erysipelotrichaceae bacterium]|nr:1-deoxy-D-xylulose-5-phosphate synthase N-terminal domain-containing protein [Erysipelotrichaceae bacterium]